MQDEGAEHVAKFDLDQISLIKFDEAYSEQSFMAYLVNHSVQAYEQEYLKAVTNN